MWLKPVHNYWARVLELRNYTFWAHVLQLLKPWNPGACVPRQENPPQWEVHALVAVVQSPSCVQLFATSWTAAHQACLSHISSWSLPKFISIALVMPSNHCILCCPLLLPSIFPSIRVFSDESAVCILGQSIGISASASVLLKCVQGWFPLRWTGLISLVSKVLWRVLSSTTVRKHWFLGALLSLLSSSHIHTWPLGRS